MGKFGIPAKHHEAIALIYSKVIDSRFWRVKSVIESHKIHIKKFVRKSMLLEAN